MDENALALPSSVSWADITAVKRVLERQAAERARLEAQLALVRGVMEQMQRQEALARWEMLGTLLDSQERLG
jgi:hypothetical protein